MSRYLGGLRSANQQRQLAGAAAQIAQVRADLAILGESKVPDHLLRAAQARLGFPNDSLAQLAARLGVTKDVVSGRLRRLYELAQQKAGTP